MTLPTRQLIKSVRIWLKGKLRNSCTTFPTFPISLMHLSLPSATTSILGATFHKAIAARQLVETVFAWFKGKL